MPDAIDLTEEDAANDVQVLQQQLCDVDEELQEVCQGPRCVVDRGQTEQPAADML